MPLRLFHVTACFYSALYLFAYCFTPSRFQIYELATEKLNVVAILASLSWEYLIFFPAREVPHFVITRFENNSFRNGSFAGRSRKSVLFPRSTQSCHWPDDSSSNVNESNFWNLVQKFGQIPSATHLTLTVTAYFCAAFGSASSGHINCLAYIQLPVTTT